MSGTTIAATTHVGLVLTAAAPGPVTLTQSGTIAVSGGISARGIVALGRVVPTIVNEGLIRATNFQDSEGIDLTSGGTITNGISAKSTARIVAVSYGVRSGNKGLLALDNLGTIAATGIAGVGVQASSGLRLVTGAYFTGGVFGGLGALISGYAEGVRALAPGARVTNYATIVATGLLATTATPGIGVHLASGGTVTNGNIVNASAVIAGAGFGVAVDHGPGRVINHGTIKATGRPTSQNTEIGVRLSAGGVVVNGNAGDLTGRDKSLITGRVAILGDGAAITVQNFGTLQGSDSGVELRAGGHVVNGSVNGHTARIAGYWSAVSLTHGGSVRNFGTIVADGTLGNTGIVLSAGGTIVNGDLTNATDALIQGQAGIVGTAGTTTVVNFGTILGTFSAGVQLSGDITIVNGNASDSVALIADGLDGDHNFDTAGAVVIYGGTARVTNFANIIGSSGVRFTNGATGTVVNHGLIASRGGSAGTAVAFASGDDRLVIAPGAAFVGKVTGGAGNDTIELAAGTGAGFIRQIGTAFAGFETLVVDANASWILQGGNSIPTVVNQRLLRLALGASLTVTQAVDPSSAGVFELLGGSVMEVKADTAAGSAIKFNATARLVIDQAAGFGTGIGSPGYTGPLLRQFASAAAIDIRDLLPGLVTLDYTPATGLLQLADSAGALATLHFDPATLGPGSFQAGDDGAGHLRITHA